ncbi:hypothetical protein F3K40_15425 [Streptomyces sp. LBUM 1478]|uniref:hypothetical protein n=1 Tax=Streptomyces scabiei TaxID=1930 RepID=UPI00076598AF|nr:hypothetical protein [Streptomyces scabiei]MBP5906848.1 hypothetical protein [Streptomyces sp. LBUM 1478]MBP5930425.1 hypothetical protein [Streptomyces sp. LBUM 1479]
MSNTAALDRPLLAPTGDPRPVELAAVDSIAASHEPELFLWIVFHLPDGGARIRYAWTAGGPELGDRVDRVALSAGLDYADWLEIGDRHCQHSTRGRIAVQAYRLRPIFADVQAGTRAPQERRDGLRAFIDCAGRATGQTPRPGLPRWFGYGPALLSRGGN